MDKNSKAHKERAAGTVDVKKRIVLKTKSNPSKSTGKETRSKTSKASGRGCVDESPTVVDCCSKKVIIPVQLDFEVPTRVYLKVPVTIEMDTPVECVRPGNDNTGSEPEDPSNSSSSSESSDEEGGNDNEDAGEDGGNAGEDNGNNQGSDIDEAQGDEDEDGNGDVNVRTQDGRGERKKSDKIDGREKSEISKKAQKKKKSK